MPGTPSSDLQLYCSSLAYVDEKPCKMLASSCRWPRYVLSSVVPQKVHTLEKCSTDTGCIPIVVFCWTYFDDGSNWTPVTLASQISKLSEEPDEWCLFP